MVPSGFVVESAYFEGDKAVIAVRASGSVGLCPWCGTVYQHVQAISVAIDQYAEKAVGNREYFLNKPYAIGGNSKDSVP